jgi:hypothetical protein
MIGFAFCAATSRAQSQASSTTASDHPNMPASQDGNANTQPNHGINSDRSKTLKDGFNTIAEGSRSLAGWGLLIIAASVAAIVGTSYIRPIDRRVRCVYLLFIPGWGFVARSIYYGDQISRRHMAALFANSETSLSEIGFAINSDFGKQLWSLRAGLVIFFFFFFFFLFFFIFVKWFTSFNQN